MVLSKVLRYFTTVLVMVINIVIHLNGSEGGGFQFDCSQEAVKSGSSIESPDTWHLPCT